MACFMQYHDVAQKIVKLLKENNFWFETFEHEPVRTSEEAAKVRPGYSLNQGAKAIIIKAKLSAEEKKFLMLVIPADLKFDNEKVKRSLGAKETRFATEEEVSLITGGIEAGGVPPLGNLFGIEVFTDPKLLENEKIIFNAGDRRFSVAMLSKDFNYLVHPKIAELI